MSGPANMTLIYHQRHDPLTSFSCECDNYKCELHPVTGCLTLYMYENHGPGSRLKAVVAGVTHFHVNPA